MTATVSPATVAIPTPGNYLIDPARSTINFQTKHMFGLGTVTGQFAIASASIQVAYPPERSTVEATIDATSFTTGNAGRDKKVRSKTFLNVAQSPKITFVSTKVRMTDSTWVLDGLLTVRGKTAPVSLTVVESVFAGSTLSIVANTAIDRSTHGITAMKGMAGPRLDVTLRLTGQPATPRA